MKKSIDTLSEAGFAVCVGIAVVVAFVLMLSDALWKSTLTEFSALDSRLGRLKRDLQGRADRLEALFHRPG